MRISVVVPVYNEEETIASVLQALAQIPLPIEVVVIDDASTDHTWDILRELRTREPFKSYRYVLHEYNRGKGAALRTGFGLIKGDLVIVQDADLEYDPRDILTLVQKWQETRYPHTVVYGYRDLSTQKVTTRWGNRFLTSITNLLFGSSLHDMETCYKLLPVELACSLPMQGRRFEIEPEITACVLQAGYHILEVPISYTPRSEKKLKPWRDGWFALAMLLRCRFRKPFQRIEALPLSPQEIAIKEGRLRRQ